MKSQNESKYFCLVKKILKGDNVDAMVIDTQIDVKNYTIISKIWSKKDYYMKK